MTNPPEGKVFWEALADAGLVEIEVDQFPERIREVKRTVMSRLGELLAEEKDWRERESAAYSLGTLKKLESKLARAGKHEE